MTTSPAAADSRPPGDTNQSRVYALVLIVEAVVITALYLFGTYFS